MVQEESPGGCFYGMGGFGSHVGRIRREPSVSVLAVREASGVGHPRRRGRPGHDRLKGVGRVPGRGRLGGFFAITIGGSLYAWDIAFAFGAYQTLLYYRRFHLLVVSLVVVLGGLIFRSRLQIPPRLLTLFAPPLLFILMQLAFPVPDSGNAVRTVYHILTLATVAVLPFIVWVVVRLLAPDYFTLPDRRLKVAVIAVVATVALIAYLIGHFNYRFLTCEDFRVAGDFQPKNCVHADDRQYRR